MEISHWKRNKQTQRERNENTLFSVFQELKMSKPQKKSHIELDLGPRVDSSGLFLPN